MEEKEKKEKKEKREIVRGPEKSGSEGEKQASVERRLANIDRQIAHERQKAQEQIDRLRAQKEAGHAGAGFVERQARIDQQIQGVLDRLARALRRLEVQRERILGGPHRGQGKPEGDPEVAKEKGPTQAKHPKN